MTNTHFTDDKARDRYAANGGNWADVTNGEPVASTYSSRAVVCIAGLPSYSV
jgi:hypothetical protein